jgi:FKBP-type peptidyl-prolyl cis-trans isomerase FkpA
MKQTIFTLLLFSALGLISCRKTLVSPGIKDVDNSQILSYISSHSITGMKRDTVGGDTSGIYYKIILPGLAGTSYQYTDSIAFVYSLSSFDGLYTSADTTFNHFDDYAGHIASIALPYGLQLVIHDVLKRGGSMRILIPSRLAYGVAGYGSGSSQNANSKIAGNQCLDYYVHSITNEAAYDDLVIRNFLSATGNTGYQRSPTGVYYLLRTPGTGTDPITNNTTITDTYTGTTLNGTIFDQFNTTDGTGATQDIPDLFTGLQQGLKSYVTTGAYVSFYIPSTLAYGTAVINSVPANSVVHYEMRIIAVSP